MIVRSGVYLITNAIDQKIYVGSSAHIAKRWMKHRNALKLGTHHCRHLQFAANRDGIDVFKFTIVEDVEDPIFLEAREQFWIWRMNATDHRFGYNTAPAAGSMLGRPLPLETRQKQSRTKKGRPLTQAHRAALRLAWATNPKRREQAAAQARRDLVGRKPSPEEIARRNAKLVGRIFSAEHRAKLSLASLGRKKAPDHVQRMRQSLTGRSLSAIHRAAISAGLRRRQG